MSLFGFTQGFFCSFPSTCHVRDIWYGWIVFNKLWNKLYNIFSGHNTTGRSRGRRIVTNESFWHPTWLSTTMSLPSFGADLGSLSCWTWRRSSQHVEEFGFRRWRQFTHHTWQFKNLWPKRSEEQFSYTTDSVVGSDDECELRRTNNRHSIALLLKFQLFHSPTTMMRCRYKRVASTLIGLGKKSVVYVLHSSLI